LSVGSVSATLSYDSIFWIRFFAIFAANWKISVSLALVFSSSCFICYLIARLTFFLSFDLSVSQIVAHCVRVWSIFVCVSVRTL